MDDFPEIPLVARDEYEAALLARNGDPERVATTTLHSLRYRGVSIESRYRKAKEMEIMAGMVKSLEGSAIYVESLSCDSKAGMTFEVRLITGDAEDAKKIATHLSEYLLQDHGGHNGIYVSGPGGIDVISGADWPEFHQQDGDQP